MSLIAVIHSWLLLSLNVTKSKETAEHHQTLSPSLVALARKIDLVTCLLQFHPSVLNADALFFSNLTLDIIEDCIPHCVQMIY